MAGPKYEVSWETATENVGIIKKILLLISIIIFLFISVITMSIMQKANVNIESCEMVAEKTAYYDYGAKVSTRNNAEKIMADVVGSVTFSADSLEVCGVAFLFKDNESTRYMLCENGKVYRIIRKCKKVL